MRKANLKPLHTVYYESVYLQVMGYQKNPGRQKFFLICGLWNSDNWKKKKKERLKGTGILIPCG